MSKKKKRGTRRFLLIWAIMLISATGLMAGLLLLGRARRNAQKLTTPAPAEIAAPAGFTPRDKPSLRVFDGMLQWYDGARWLPLSEASTLLSGDPAAPTDDGVSQPPSSATRAAGTVPRKGGGSGGGGGGGSSGGSDSGDGEDINPFG